MAWHPAPGDITLPHQLGPSSRLPELRAQEAHFGYDTDQSCRDLILAGGDNDDTIDVATTDFLTQNSSPKFVRLEAKTIPPVRRHAVLVLDPQTRTVLLFGGLQGTGLPGTSTLLGDTWLYHLGSCPN